MSQTLDAAQINIGASEITVKLTKNESPQIFPSYVFMEKLVFTIKLYVKKLQVKCWKNFSL